ncbi:winged helix-turn-helix transcriptional regulator [Demequina silvatica]|uniref:winged helix-turn-helix transcriptional regulator n=1 Tax=Demequina silvatica TaxID=1638988 RepID=UPI0007856E2C|nr:helix-turn-helix domain-containing protein [Demequina silvatica]
MSQFDPLHACHYTEQVFRLFGKRWTGLIVDLLLQRPARFSELRDALPELSNRVLSQRLAELQDAGLVARDVDPGPAITVTYRLTANGEGLGPAMVALRVWAGAPTDADGNPVPLSALHDQLVSGVPEN